MLINAPDFPLHAASTRCTFLPNGEIVQAGADPGGSLCIWTTTPVVRCVTSHSLGEASGPTSEVTSLIVDADTGLIALAPRLARALFAPQSGHQHARDLGDWDAQQSSLLHRLAARPQECGAYARLLERATRERGR